MEDDQERSEEDEVKEVDLERDLERTKRVSGWERGSD